MQTRRIMGIQGVGSAIREERLNQGLTQAQLAAKARVSREWLSGVERGERFGAELSKVLAVLSALDLVMFLSSRDGADAPSQEDSPHHPSPAQEQVPITTDEATREAIKAMMKPSESDVQAAHNTLNIAELLPEDLLQRIAARLPAEASESFQNRLRRAKDQGQQS